MHALKEEEQGAIVYVCSWKLLCFVIYCEINVSVLFGVMFQLLGRVDEV